MSPDPAGGVDPFAVSRAARVPSALAPFNAAGVLHAADVHVAARLAGMAGETDPDVLLAVALAVRGPRLGSVLVDLADVHRTATPDNDAPDDVDVAALPWPAPATWPARVGASPLVAAEADATTAPLRLAGSQLYLDRYWREETAVAADLAERRDAPPRPVDEPALADGLRRLFDAAPPGASAAPLADAPAAPPANVAQASLFDAVEAPAGSVPAVDRPGGGELQSRSGGGPVAQRRAAETAVRRALAVVAGGPGTGKTTTVARIAALLFEQARALGEPAPQLVLAAPTAKAAARLQEVVREQAVELDVAPAVRDALLALEAMTLHRLLGWRPGARGRFRHDRANRLPHDGVIVDETSMVSLSLMARLLEAVRADARLVLVGDPGQLSSVEAGAVLGDVVGPAAETPRAGIVVLDRVMRYGGAIAAVADAIRAGDADATLAALRAGGGGAITWIEADAANAAETELAPVREGLVRAAGDVIAAARDGDAGRALAGLGAYRLLCAHRTGPHGAAGWLRRIEGWLATAIDGFEPTGGWYAGRPLLVTENDYGLRLFNGDTGVVVATPTSVAAAFARADGIVRLSPTRLATVETVYAMTIHKSQGSQFATTAVVLPDPGSRILSRELLYTAVTRARERLVLVGTEDVVRAAVRRPVARASGLAGRLWG